MAAPIRKEWNKPKVTKRGRIEEWLSRIYEHISNVGDEIAAEIVSTPKRYIIVGCFSDVLIESFFEEHMMNIQAVKENKDDGYSKWIFFSDIDIQKFDTIYKFLDYRFYVDEREIDLKTKDIYLYIKHKSKYG